MEAIILAGGLGTRLKSVAGNLPKPMVPVGSKPFLALLLDELISQNVDRIILSIGYKHETFLSYFKDTYKSCEIVYSIEDKPMGTGGAIKYALNHAQSENILVINGDTLFRVPLKEMLNFHLKYRFDLTMALKPMKNFERYGSVILSQNKIIRFEEKKYKLHGNINGGIYILKKNLFQQFELPDRFSFETDYLKQNLNKVQMGGFIADEYFIDIGIPEDYEKALSDLAG